MAPRLPKPPPPKAPQEALKWFASKVPFTRPERDALSEEAKKRAFFISNVAQLNLVADAHKAITKAIRNGTTLADFKKAMEAKLTREWGVERPAVVETIFRNGVQSAYNAGRLEQFEDPLVKRFRPMRGWAVILDGRTTEFICRPLASVVVQRTASSPKAASLPSTTDAARASWPSQKRTPKRGAECEAQSTCHTTWSLKKVSAETHGGHCLRLT